MSYIIVVNHAESGSSTSIGSDTRVGALVAALEWLGGDFYFVEESNE